MIQVWDDRSVYDKTFVDKLKKTLESKEPADLTLTRSPTTPPETLESSKSNVKKSTSGTKLHKSLSSNLYDNYSKSEIDKIIAEFQPRKLCDTIAQFVSTTNELNLTRKEVEATKILDITVESIKQYRDKRQCAKFKTDFEASMNKLNELVLKLNDQAEKRKELVKLLEQSEIFYDAQYNDARTVSNVNFFLFPTHLATMI